MVDSFERIGGKRKCEILTRKRFGFGWLCGCLTVKDARTMKKEKQVQAELPPDVVLKSDSLQKVKA